MTVIRELITKWGFDVDGKPLDAMEGQVAGLKKGLAVVGGLAVAGAATLFAWAKTAADAGDDAAKTARTLGITAESFQELAYAADLAGIKSGELQKGLSRVNTTADEALKGGKKAQEQFAALGISLDDLRDKDASEILMQMSDGFAALPDGLGKAALGVEFFGDRNAKMINMLDGGSASLRELRLEAIRSGNVIGEDTTKKAERFNDALTRLRKMIRGIVLIIGADLVEQFTDGAESLALFVADARELIKLRLEQTLKLIVDGLKFLWKWGSFAYKQAARLVEAMGGLERVLRIVGLLLAVFVTFKALMGLKAMIGLVIGLVKAYRLMGAAAMLANAKAMLIPLAIAALIVLLGLVVDDFRAFFNGQDSAIGELVKKWPALGTAIYATRDAIVSAQDSGADFLMWLLGPAGEQGTSVFHRWGEAIGDAIFNGVQSAKAALGTFFTWAAEGIKKIPGFEMMMGLAAKSAQTGADIANRFMGDTTGASSAGADARGAQARAGSSSTFNGGAMNITQAPGESGEDFAARVAAIQREQWDRQMRAAQDDLGPQGAY